MLLRTNSLGIRINTRPSFTCPKFNDRNTRTRREICSGVFIVNFEHISRLALVFLLLTLNM